MKHFNFFSSTVVAALIASVAEARLYHLALGTTVSNANRNNRGLASVASSPSSETDLDNLYQARGVQYVDLKVGR